VNYPERVFLGSDIYVGPYAAFNSVGGIRIGTGSVLGPFVHIYSGNHYYEGADALPFDERMVVRPVDIGVNVWIGGDVTILPGVRVGEGAVVGAGALVTKDVPEFTVVAGCPARVIKQRDVERYARLKENGNLLNRVVGSGRNRPQLVGSVPTEWFEEAGLPVPSKLPLSEH
jgi:acetyltransferase-like isoleucine patch superfamily enzyme